MERLRRIIGTLAVTLVVGLGITLAPQPAHAAFSLGIDGMWVPAVSNSAEADDIGFVSGDTLDSYGLSAQGRLGFDVFSVGLKLNYFNQGIVFEGVEEEVRLDELDINALLEVGIPATGLTFFGEIGPSFSLDNNDVGWNAGLGAEYAIFSAAVLDFNLGTELQYVSLPAELNEMQRDNEALRLMLFLGVDFGI